MNRLTHILSHLDNHQSIPLSSNPTWLPYDPSQQNKIGVLGNADVGGNKQYELNKLNRDHKTLQYWERQVDALEYVLLRKKIMNAHQLRKGIESLPPKSYINITYYEKWMYSILTTLLSKGYYTEKELQSKYIKYMQTNAKYNENNNNPSNKPRFNIGDTVKVRDIFDTEIANKIWRISLKIPEKQHIRTPGYIQNKVGIIESYVGSYKNAELSSIDIPHQKCNLYRVRFKQNEIWKDSNNSRFNENDTIDVELMEHWLQKSEIQDHDHDHDHKSDPDGLKTQNNKNREIVEKNAIDIEPTVSIYQILSRCVIELLVEKKVITMNEIRKQIESVDNSMYDNLGARIVVKIWRNPEWKKKLMSMDNTTPNKNPYKLIRQEFKEIPEDYYETNLRIVENTKNIHNVVVCTLCSCYPRQILGIPPAWYKSLKYRSEIVYRPRELLMEEFGTVIPEDVMLRVHDSTSDLRYIVLPDPVIQIGENWERLGDDELVNRVTRDMMIGVVR